MKSFIFTVTLRSLKFILGAVAFWVLFRGHNAPGGGFIGGLILASASILQILSEGWNSLLSWKRNNLFFIMGLGLSIAILSGVFSLLYSNSFMTGIWGTFLGMQIGTPLIFDIGVFLVVYAVVLRSAGALLAEEEGTL